MFQAIQLVNEAISLGNSDVNDREWTDLLFPAPTIPLNIKVVSLFSCIRRRRIFHFLMYHETDAWQPSLMVLVMAFNYQLRELSCFPDAIP